MRASDADRERVIADLQRHTQVGRLTLDEFSERVGAVYEARTVDELAETTADLPAERTVAAAELDPHVENTRHLVLIFIVAMLVIVAFGTFYGLAT